MGRVSIADDDDDEARRRVADVGALCRGDARSCSIGADFARVKKSSVDWQRRLKHRVVLKAGVPLGTQLAS